MQRNRYAVFMAQAGHKVSRFVDFRCVRFQFRFRLAVCVSRLGFVFGISDFGFGFGFVWGFLAALYGIFAIMNGPGLGSHSKCQCYCTRAAGVYFFFVFCPVHLCICKIFSCFPFALISIWRCPWQKRRWLTFSVCLEADRMWNFRYSRRPTLKSRLQSDFDFELESENI